jgi:hypothetical protein
VCRIWYEHAEKERRRKQTQNTGVLRCFHLAAFILLNDLGLCAAGRYKQPGWRLVTAVLQLCNAMEILLNSESILLM